MDFQIRQQFHQAQIHFEPLRAVLFSGDSELIRIIRSIQRMIAMKRYDDEVSCASLII